MLITFFELLDKYSSEVITGEKYKDLFIDLEYALKFTLDISVSQKDEYGHMLMQKYNGKIKEINYLVNEHGISIFMDCYCDSIDDTTSMVIPNIIKANYIKETTEDTYVIESTNIIDQCPINSTIIIKQGGS